MKKAAELEPNDDDVPNTRFTVLKYQGRFPEALAVLDQKMAGRSAPFFHHSKARLLMDWKGDLGAARAELASLPADPGSAGYLAMTRLTCECRARDFDAAARVLDTSPAELWSDRGSSTGLVPRSYYAGLLARYRDDEAAATNILTSARLLLEQKVRAQDQSPDVLLALATVNAGLGRSQDALAEARRALVLGQAKKDARYGPLYFLAYARVLAWTGERDEAIHTLQALAAKPGGPAYGDLKLHPDWDVLRGDARFEVLVASLASN
ncbi:MAG: hypothetical protein INR62_08945 [Rhodospirillales bacterium]|nr:hypothetical protein [Acetobacter sp.]